MPAKLYSAFYLLGLIFLFVLIGCSDPADAPAATPTTAPALAPENTHTSTPARTPLPTPTTPATHTPSPTRTTSQLLFSGSTVAADTAVSCNTNLPPGSFILGANTADCQPASSAGGSARFLVQAPPGDGNQIALLHISCSDFDAGCTEAVQLNRPGGVISIYDDQQLLWQADCTSLTAVECSSRFLGQTLTIAFASEDTAVHDIQIQTSPHISWQIADIQVEWQPVPQLIRGIAFSPFRDCQNPLWGPFPSPEQVREDLLLVQHMGNAVRTYSSVGVQGQIPEMAQELGLRVTAGAWLGPDREANEAEIEAVINLVQQDVGIESVIVGNEVLLRGDLTEAELIAYIERVKTAVDVPVTSAETIGHLENHPELIEAVDYVLVHIYAYWDGIPIQNAAQYTLDKYRLTQEIAGGKRVVIGETGWPSNGPANGTAVPSIANEQRFWREFLTLAQQEEIEFFFFAAFDELWKTEGGVGPYWGMLNSERINKFGLQSVFVPMNYVPQPGAEAVPMPTATPGAVVVSAQEELFPVFINYAAAENHFAPSGYMGDYGAISYNDCARLTETWEETAVEIQYDPSLENEAGWAGIYWQEPENNWGTYAEGYNLENFAQLHFRARSPQDGSQVQFFVGGVFTGTYPSSLPEPIYAQEADREGFVTLSTEWQEFHIDLQNADLSHVIDGFGWVATAKRSPEGVIVYVDDIVFSQQRLPTATPRPTAPPAATATPASLPEATPAPQPHIIYAGNTLASGYDMGVDTGPSRLTNWVSDIGGSMCMNYPGGQSWGAVFITHGIPEPPGSRPGEDLSQFSRLYVELKGEVENQSVQIGLKDNLDPDNGTETKYTVTPPTEWQGYAFPLSDFHTADPSSLYVMIEFVFGSAPSDICFRNVMYLP